MGKAAVKIRGLQLLPLSEVIGEVKNVGASGHADLLLRILLHGNLPGAAPSQRAKPDIPEILVLRGSTLDRKPWIILGTCRSAPAFKHCFSWPDRLLFQVPFSVPSSCKVAQLIVRATREVPGSSGDLFDGDRAGSFVLHSCRAPED